MLPRTGSTWIGDFGSRPGMVPAPASAPSSVCAPSGPPASTPARASTNLVNPLNPLNPLNPDLAGIGRSLARRRGLRGWRHRFQLLAVLRIHSLGAAARRVVGNAVVHAEFVQVRIGPRQQMRDDPARAIDF